MVFDDQSIFNTTALGFVITYKSRIIIVDADNIFQLKIWYLVSMYPLGRMVTFNLIIRLLINNTEFPN